MSHVHILPNKRATVLPFSVMDCEQNTDSGRRRQTSVLPLATANRRQGIRIFEDKQVTVISSPPTSCERNTLGARKKRATVLPFSVMDCERNTDSGRRRQTSVLPLAATNCRQGIRLFQDKQVTVISSPPTSCERNTPDARKRRNSTIPFAATECGQEIRSTRDAQVTPALPPVFKSGRGIHGIEEKNISTNFRWIITAALLIGLPIPPSMTYPDSKKIAAFLQTWSAIVFCVRVVLIVFACVYNHLMWPSYAMRYSYLFHCLVGFSLMLIISSKRHGIRASLMKLERLSLDSRHRAKDDTSLMDVLMSLGFACFIFLLVLGVIFYFSTSWDFFVQQIAILSPVPQDSILVHYYNFIVISSLLLSYNFCSATTWVTTFICCHACLTSGRLLHRLQERLKNDSERGCMTATVASRNLRSYERIFSCVSDLNDALNRCTICVYAAVINGFYIVLSISLSPGHGFGSGVVISIDSMIGLVSTVQFLLLTLFGDFLRTRHHQLQNSLVEVTNGVVVKSSVQGMHMFSLLCANIRTTELRLTGLKYFSVDRKIIPSVISVVITYGVVIYQVGIMEK